MATIVPRVIIPSSSGSGPGNGALFLPRAGRVLLVDYPKMDSYPLKLQATWGSSHLLQTLFAQVTQKVDKSRGFKR